MEGLRTCNWILVSVVVVDHVYDYVKNCIINGEIIDTKIYLYLDVDTKVHKMYVDIITF
jgi:hypothetical protein